VAHHLIFNGFLVSYKEWVHHGESIFTSSISKPHSGSHSDTNAESNQLAHINTIGMLKDFFGINKEGCIHNDNDNNVFDIGDPMIGEYAEFDDEPDSDHVLNKGEHIEDARIED